MATNLFKSSRGLLTVIGLLWLANQYSGLRLSPPNEMLHMATFQANDETTYHLYKPRCAGLYRSGEVFTLSLLNPDQGIIPPPTGLLSCVGLGSEAQAATSYNYLDNTLGASLFELYSENLSLSALGHASLTDNVFRDVFLSEPTGSVPTTSLLRQYAVLLDPTCDQETLPACSAFNIIRVNFTTFANETVDNETITISTTKTHRYVYWNPLQNIQSYGDDHMVLMRYLGTEDSPTSFVPFCFNRNCLCPSCTNGICEARGNCICNGGWQGSNCNQDVDECASNVTNDCATIARCDNTPGGYTCTCPSGYTTANQGRLCQDINECLDPVFNKTCTDVGKKCVNIPGSFQCNDCLRDYVQLPNGTCLLAADVYRCGNGVRDVTNNEECDGGAGCDTNCKCSPGFSPQNDLSCSRNCGNGVLDKGEECDGGEGCLALTCLCNENVGFVFNNATSCKREDACLAQNGNCSECLLYNCFYCTVTDTCASERVSGDCVAECPVNGTAPIAVPSLIEPEANSPSNNGSVVGPDGNPDFVDPGANIEVIVPAIVVPVVVVTAGIILLVFLLKRRKKERGLSEQELRLSASSRTSANSSRSKYGIDRTEIMTVPTQTWKPSPQSEFVLVNKLPFELSKERIDFSLGGNQYKVGQRYTEVIVVGAKDKKSSTLGGAIQFAFHPPSTPKATLEFNPSSGVVKKGKPVEVEVSLVVNMTCTLDLEWGIECPSERMHTFASINIVSELSSFIDLEEVQLVGGASAKPVGDGAFGVVYKGKYRGQDVAVKMLKVQDMPEEMLDEFDREVDLMSKLRHKNIVQFLGASKVVGKFALITEFIERGNLADRVFKHSNKPIDYGFKLKAALDTARAMLFLHENRVLHRDLKLDNLLVVSAVPDDPVCVKLTDFGSSRAVSEKISNSYTSGVGTPLYMAPEILTKKPYDTKSDVYSFGIMLWILYTQKQPYTNFEHSWDVAQFVIEGNREKIPKDCPADYKTLIELCWSQDPTERPTFAYIIEQLEHMFETYRASMPTQSNSKRKSTFLV